MWRESPVFCKLLPDEACCSTREACATNQSRCLRPGLTQARLKADFIEQTWRDLSAVTMVQPEDLRGRDGVAELSQGQRLVANLSGLPDGTTTAQVVRTVLGQKLGLSVWPSGCAVASRNHRQQSRRSADAAAGFAGQRRCQGGGGAGGNAARQSTSAGAQISFGQAVGRGADDNVPDGAELPEPLDGAILVAPGHKGERSIASCCIRRHKAR